MNFYNHPCNIGICGENSLTKIKFKTKCPVLLAKKENISLSVCRKKGIRMKINNFIKEQRTRYDSLSLLK